MSDVDRRIEMAQQAMDYLREESEELKREIRCLRSACLIPIHLTEEQKRQFLIDFEAMINSDCLPANIVAVAAGVGAAR